MATVPTITGTMGIRVPLASRARKISQTPKTANPVVTATNPSGRKSSSPEHADQHGQTHHNGRRKIPASLGRRVVPLPLPLGARPLCGGLLCLAH